VSTQPIINNNSSYFTGSEMELNIGTISSKKLRINAEIIERIDYSILNILELLMKGKTFEKDKEEFLKEFMKLPWVNRNNLKALQAFKKFRAFVYGFQKLMEEENVSKSNNDNEQ